MARQKSSFTKRTTPDTATPPPSSDPTGEQPPVTPTARARRPDGMDGEQIVAAAMKGGALNPAPEPHEVMMQEAAVDSSPGAARVAPPVQPTPRPGPGQPIRPGTTRVGRGPTQTASSPYDERIAEVAAQVAALQADGETLEAKEQGRSKTCLSYGMQLLKCRWMTPHYHQGTDIPTWTYPPGGRRCHVGKTEPDQDCRHCPFVQIIPFGTQSHFPPHERRYQDHGMVVPIPDQETADKIADYLFGTLGLAHMRDPQQEAAALGDLLEQLKAQRAAHFARQQVESPQRGRGPRPLPTA